MPKFAPNLYHLFTELPIRKRFAAAAAHGFDAVEWHFPYELPKHELKALLTDNGLQLVHALMPVDQSVTWGLAGQPDKIDEFKRSAELALEYAATVGIATLHPHPGQMPPQYSQEQCLDVLVSNLDYFCAQAASLDLTLVLESVCTIRAPKTMLRTLGQAAEVVKEVGRPNLKVLYDSYHVRNEEAGSLCAIFDEFQEVIGHVQIANVPGRHEPGVGDVDLQYFISHMHECGYRGWIGLEYDPLKDTASSLSWLANYKGIRAKLSK
ncbi:Hydroxypyruvate isomerase [Pseudomonas chlororaphis]|uniref:Hydroxypyruvate isomerase n=1 Tax=Pseudomonas chlororaphis TaxID=587753 RepID=A0A3G7U0Z5_9PSED|nr:TIM barrel protein [Pseudomonas chlororaphis]AZE52166.1 Hydroxypyruvate isomerase [Pseudomonas chlororaphis]